MCYWLKNKPHERKGKTTTPASDSMLMKTIDISLGGRGFPSPRRLSRVITNVFTAHILYLMDDSLSLVYTNNRSGEGERLTFQTWQHTLSLTLPDNQYIADAKPDNEDHQSSITLNNLSVGPHCDVCE